MGIFVRAVITGFGFSVGTALFKRVSKQLGLETEDTQTPSVPDGDSDGAPGDAEVTVH